MSDRYLDFTCVCGQQVKVPLGDDGQPAVCPNCDAEFLVDQALEPSDLPALRNTCDACGAPLDLASAEARGEAFVICSYCGHQYDRNDSRLIEWGEFVATSVETTWIADTTSTSQLWEFEGKKFKTLEALADHLRTLYPSHIVDEILASLRGGGS